MLSDKPVISHKFASEIGVCIAPSPAKIAWRDLTEGLRLWRLWTLLAWYGVKQRYQRSVLGPLWLTISMGILVFALGFLYSGIFAQSTQRFLPHVAAGFIFWGLISSIVNEGCSVFLHAGQTIRNVELPFSVYTYRMIFSSLIILGHNFLVFIIVILVYQIEVSYVSLLAVFGLLLIIANGIWAGLLLGMIGLRYRDAPQMIGSIMHLSFFLTPIFWTLDSVPEGKAMLIRLNPFYHLLELVRAPLLGSVPSLESWLVGGVLPLFGWTITLLVFARYRPRLAYWV